MERYKKAKRTTEMSPAKLVPTNCFQPVQTVVLDKFCDDDFATVSVLHDRNENSTLFRHRLDSKTRTKKTNGEVDVNQWFRHPRKYLVYISLAREQWI